MEESKSYRPVNIGVCQFRGKKYLSYLKMSTKEGVTNLKESKSAKFIVMEESGRDTTLSAFEPVLSRIMDGVSDQDLHTKLLSALPKVFRFNDRIVIVFSVQEK